MTLASRIAEDGAGTSILARIIPKQIDNAYRGHWLAIVLLVLNLILRTVMGFNSIVFTRTVATSADGIPLDSYGHDAAGMVLLLFALLGVYGLFLPLLSVVALIRYRAMIPLVYVLLLVFQLGSRAVRLLHPTASLFATPVGFYVNLGLLALTIIGFGLSLWPRRAAA